MVSSENLPCQLGRNPLKAKEILKLTAEIILPHATLSELTPQQLVEEIIEDYPVLSSLESGIASEILAPEKAPEFEAVKKPPIPLRDIVTQLL